MAMDTIIQQGRFTADGSAKVLEVRSDIDWMDVINYTQASTTQATGRSVRFFWQRGMSDGTGIGYYKTNNLHAINMDDMVTGGFTLVDTSGDPVGTINSTITAVSGATPPVVSLTSTAGLSNNDVVRLINIVGAQQLGGIDFTIGTLVANTSFALTFAPTIVAGTTGSLRRIEFDPIYYPRRRYITSITAAASAVVALTVTHGYVVGQQVRFSVPSNFGMVEMDGLLGTITAVNTTLNTITVDIDSSAFTAFAWPLTAGVPFTPAQVIPVGEAAESTYVNKLDDATDNVSYIGMILGSGINAPAGSANDVIYWRAGKAFSVTNE